MIAGQVGLLIAGEPVLCVQRRHAQSQLPLVRRHTAAQLIELLRFSCPHVAMQKSSTSLASDSTHMDVFVQCALAEEADSTLRVLMGTRDISQLPLSDGTFPHGETYRVVQLQLTGGHRLRIGIGHQSDMGPSATAQYCGAVQASLQTWGVRLWAMTGILAGVHGECQLGDVV
jgi:hypothetical protein